MAMNYHLEALKLLKEWSTALVVIQTAAIAVLGGIVKDGNVGLAKPWLGVAFVCFLISILVAANLIGAMPRIVQNLETLVKRHGDIYRMRNALGIPLTVLALLEHLFFAAGIASFAYVLYLK